MNDKEYSDWVAAETAKSMLYAVAVYAVALALYWTLVG